MKSTMRDLGRDETARRPCSYLVLAALSVALFGCTAARISRKAEVQAIKKIAVVSLSVNDQIYNAKAGPMSVDDYARAKKKADHIKDYSGQTTDTTLESTRRILEATSGIYTDTLKGIPNWEVIPIEVIKDQPAYQAFVAEPVDEKDFVPTMVIEGSKYFNPFRDHRYYREENRKTFLALAELCKQLGVDAVVVVRTKLGYEPVGVQLLGGFGNLLASKKTGALPTIGNAISVVTKGEQSAVFNVSKMEYQGPEVNMLQAGLVNFTGDDGVIIQSYKQAIQAGAQALVDRINKELVED